MEDSAMAKAAPKKTFRIGNVSASVFVNEVGRGDDKRQVRSVTLQRSYLDGEERKYTSSFGLADLPAALRVLQLATDFVESHEADVTA